MLSLAKINDRNQNNLIRLCRHCNRRMYTAKLLWKCSCMFVLTKAYSCRIWYS